MNFLRATGTHCNITPLPEGTSRDKAIALLHNHDFYIYTGPSVVSYKELPSPDPSTHLSAQTADDKNSEKDDSLQSRVRPVHPPKRYECCENVPGILSKLLPGGASQVKNEYTITDTESGIYVRIKSAMTVVMEQLWEVREVDGDGHGLELVEHAALDCPRPLLKTAQNQCIQVWKGVHGKFLKGLEG